MGVQTSFIQQEWYSDQIDETIFIISIIWLLTFNFLFAIYGWYLRRDENLKLSYSSDEVEKEVNLSRPRLRFDYRKGMRSGERDRLLSFIAYTHASDSMDETQKEALKKKQVQMDKLYNKRK